MNRLLLLFLLLCGLLPGHVLGQKISQELLARTKKISLIHVGAMEGLSESSFGHIALRLSPEEKPGLMDLVVEFVADVPENENPFVKYLKGAGILDKYKVLADAKSFFDYRKRKTIIEDRDVTVKELTLSAAEVQMVVKYILDYQNDLSPETYTFLKRNCSYFAALALEQATEKRIKHKNKPWKIPEALEKAGLVSNTDVYPRATFERKRLATKFLSEESSILPAEWKDGFVAMLGEAEFVFRQSSYMKLLWVLQQPGLEEKSRKKVSGLVRYLLPHENEVTQLMIKNLFRNPEQKKVIVLKDIHTDELVAKIPSRKKSIQHDLIVNKDKIYLELSWSGSNEEDSGQVKVQVPVPLKLNPQDNSLSYHQQKVGRFFNTKKHDWILSQQLDYALESDSSRKTLRSFLYLDLTQQNSLKKSLAEIKQLSHLSINNAIDFKGQVGSCYAMTLLQKAFYERAIFLPDNKAASTADKFQVMKALLDGNYVVIPGYANIMEFTSSIDKEQLKQFVSETQVSLTKNSLQQLIDNVSKRQPLNSKSILTLQSFLDEGLTLPLIIGMKEKNKNKLASDVAHMVLLFHMEPIENGYRLTAYDPNTGINTLFTLDQDYKLHYPFYDSNYDYVGMLDYINPVDVNLDHAVRSRTPDFDRLSQELKKGHPLIVPATDVAKILK